MHIVRTVNLKFLLIASIVMLAALVSYTAFTAMPSPVDASDPITDEGKDDDDGSENEGRAVLDLFIDPPGTPYGAHASRHGEYIEISWRQYEQESDVLFQVLNRRPHRGQDEWQIVEWVSRDACENPDSTRTCKTQWTITDYDVDDDDDYEYQVRAVHSNLPRNQVYEYPQSKASDITRVSWADDLYLALSNRDLSRVTPTHVTYRSSITYENIPGTDKSIARIRFSNEPYNENLHQLDRDAFLGYRVIVAGWGDQDLPYFFSDERFMDQDMYSPYTRGASIVVENGRRYYIAVQDAYGRRILPAEIESNNPDIIQTIAAASIYTLGGVLTGGQPSDVLEWGNIGRSDERIAKKEALKKANEDRENEDEGNGAREIYTLPWPVGSRAIGQYTYPWVHDFTAEGPVRAERPSGLTSESSTGSVTLSWDTADEGDEVTGYQIQRWTRALTDGTDPQSSRVMLSADTGDTSTSYIDSTVTDGERYEYEIRAINSIGTSYPGKATVRTVPGRAHRHDLEQNGGIGIHRLGHAGRDPGSDRLPHRETERPRPLHR